MQHKLLNVLGMVLIVLGTNQCDCSGQPVYDTINVNLQWGNKPQLIELAGLDVKTAKGLTCWVPSEKTTYFINAADGKTYKFTQEGGKLECQASGNAVSFNLGKAFVFAAGSMQKQNLYLGTLSGGQVTIHQLEEGTWKQATSQNVSTSFQGSAIQEDKFIVACTLQLDGQQQGCIMLIHKKAPKFELGCLLFDPTKKNVTKVNISSYPQGINYDTYLIGALGVNPGKVLLGKGYLNATHKDSYDILQIEASTLHLLSKDFKNSSYTIPAKKSNTPKPRWELFSLVIPGGDPVIPVPIFTIATDNGNSRTFYRLNTKGDFQLTNLPLDTTNNPSLVIPLGDKLCLITTRPKPITDEQQNGGQQEEVIYYQAQFDKGKEESTQEPD